jgi:hypothetical protein
MRLVSLPLILLLSAPALAQDTVTLHTWGKVAPVKKTGFFELKYQDRSGPKPKSAKAYLEVPEGVSVYGDRMIPLNAVEAGKHVWIFGKAVERESTVDGRTQIDRQIVNTSIVACGDGLEVPGSKTKTKDAPTWLEAEVISSAQGLRVRYDGNEYKVVGLKSLVVFIRLELEKQPKLKKQLVEVTAKPSKNRPEKAKEEQKSYSVQRLVFLDKRLAKTAYRRLLP